MNTLREKDFDLMVFLSVVKSKVFYLPVVAIFVGFLLTLHLLDRLTVATAFYSLLPAFSWFLVAGRLLIEVDLKELGSMYPTTPPHSSMQTTDRYIESDARGRHRSGKGK